MTIEVKMLVWILLYMHFESLLQAQIDGNVVGARFTLPRREKVSPPKAPAPPPKRDVSKSDGADAEKDGPKRIREGKISRILQ